MGTVNVKKIIYLVLRNAFRLQQDAFFLHIYHFYICYILF